MCLHLTVRVGAYDSKWAILMLRDSRYRFTDKATIEIYEIRNSSRVWQRVDKDDYAMVARFHNKVTDNAMVVIARLRKVAPTSPRSLSPVRDTSIANSAGVGTQRT